MALTKSGYGDTDFNPDLYLLPDEQDLLLTALNSNKPTAKMNGSVSTPATKGSKPTAARANSNPKKPAANATSTTNDDIYTSPLQQAPNAAPLSNLAFDESPFLDYDLDEGNYDWDLNGEQMVGELPGTSVDDDDENLHDKRKNSDDGEDDEGGGKRREGDDKTGKKPGRKLLTSEPTSKRKAQNRAAQRAFRERKERHLKELETKVEDLEKASESANHENGLLRAQVDRLQTELREFRKRISLNGAATVSRSPTQAQPLSSKANWDISNNFQFEFPAFGSSTVTKTTPRQSPGSVTQAGPGAIRGPSFSTASPKSFIGSRTSSYSSNALTTPAADDLTALFSPSILESASHNGSVDFVSFSNKNGITQPSKQGSLDNPPVNFATANVAASDSTASPSASSTQNGLNSSCGTTPEPSADSPDQNRVSEEGQEDFCKQFAMACGNKDNPIPPMLSGCAGLTPSAFIPKTPGSEFPSIDWMASQNGGAFDPILFGDYRDPQDNIMNGDIGNFFNDAFPLTDFNSPSNAPLETGLPPKRQLMQQIEDTQSGKEPEVVPGDGMKQFLTCNMLWDRVQRSERVQSGEADMDDLCTQLKAKAKCSGSGAVIDQKDVDEILGPAADTTADFFNMFK